MRFFVVILVACFLGINATSLEEDINVKWGAYKAKYDKTYSPREELLRKANFIETLDRLAELNENRGSAQFGINKFADYSRAEKEQMLGVKLSEKRINDLKSKASKKSAKISVRQEEDELPTSVDWRKEGVVLEKVKDQKTCAAGWAFACTSVLESVYALRKGKLLSLSEQDFLDCSGAGDCKGGDPFKAYMNMAVADKGVDEEKCYPYKMAKGACRKDTNCSRAFVYGTEMQDDESSIKWQLAHHGPTLGLVSVNSKTGWFDYKGGIYQGPCGEHINHAVSIIGYTENAWLIRNSWGDTWGDKGYMLLARGNNTCGIEKRAGQPLIVE